MMTVIPMASLMMVITDMMMVSMDGPILIGSEDTDLTEDGE